MLAKLESHLRPNAARLILINLGFMLLALLAVANGPGTQIFLASESEGSGSARDTDGDQPTQKIQTAEQRAKPVLSVGDGRTLEGTGVTTTVGLTLKLSEPSQSPVTATYETADGTASASDDYVLASGEVVISAGQTQTVVDLEVIGDAEEESDERFYLDISSIDGADPGDSRGGVTVLDDDGPNEGRTLPAESPDSADLDAHPPVIKLTTPLDTLASTGWYNIASSGTDGVAVSATATDASGVQSLSCKNGPATVLATTDSGSFTLMDGVHSISCTATDGEGNRGFAADSTEMPAAFKVDQTEPQLQCGPSTKFILNQPGAEVMAEVSDVTSGPAAQTARGSANTAQVGQSLTAHVTGADVAGNLESTLCSYAVIYRFSGFEPPISSGVQEEQAGRTIPVKWRISDWFDVGVSDPASFTTLTSFSTSCGTDRSGEATESSPGKSGLQSHGDGNWQFNWKTPRSYSGQCKTMSLNLLDGESDRLAFIRFR